MAQFEKMVTIEDDADHLVKRSTSSIFHVLEVDSDVLDARSRECHTACLGTHRSTVSWSSLLINHCENL